MPSPKAIFLTILLCLSPALCLWAQEQDSDSDSLIRLDYGKTAELIEINGQSVRKVIGPAEFMHNNTYMLCDTALWNIDTQIIDAMGHVSIIQEGTVLTSESMVYYIEDDLAQFRGHLVQLEDKDKNTLRTSYLDYNTKDSVAVFDHGGSMRDKDGQLIESIQGTYDSKIKLFTFKDDVNMFTDSIFVKTTYLEYQSDINKATFGRETDAWKEDNMLSADAGWYDRDREIFFFRNNVHVMNDTQEGWSDSLYFYRGTMDVDMRGHVQVTDTSRNVTAVAGRMIYVDSLSRVTMVREPAVIGVTEENEKRDSVYVGADTMVYYTLRMCDVDSVVVVNAAERLKEIEVDPVGTYRAQAAAAAAKAREDAEKNDPNYRPPAGGDAQTVGASSIVSEGDFLSSGGGDESSGPPGPPEGREDRGGPPEGRGDMGGPPERGAVDRSAGEFGAGMSPDLGAVPGEEGLGLGRDSLGVGGAGLVAGRDSLNIGRDSLNIGRDSLSAGRDSLSAGRDSLNIGRDSLSAGRDFLGAGRDSLGASRDSLGAGRDSLSTSRDSLNTTRDSLGTSRDSLDFGRDSLGTGRDSLDFGRDSLEMGADSLGVAADSLAGPLDTTKVNFIWAVGNVRMYKEDMQMACDSLEYCDLDSLVRMYKETVIWNEISQQYTADSIFVVMRDGKMEKASLMSESYIVIEEEPNQFYDQIKSVEALAFFDSGGQLSRFDALGSATGAFFLREQDVVATANKTDSKMLSATFVDGNIDKVYYFQDIKSDAYPVVQLAKEEQTFKGFNWQPERRPADPTAVTKVKPRPGMRREYASRPRAAFDQTEIYFPGYIPGIYIEIQQRDSLERVHSVQRRIAQEREEKMLADSLAREDLLALVDSVSAIDTTMFRDTLALADSLARADKLAMVDTLALKDSLATADSLARRDSLVRADSLAKEAVRPPTKEELKAKALAAKEKAQAEREAARQKKIDEREEKWAMLDSLDAAKVAAKQAKKDAKLRKKKLKYLLKMDAQNAKEAEKLEKYVGRIAAAEEKKEARAAAAAAKVKTPKAAKSSARRGAETGPPEELTVQVGIDTTMRVMIDTTMRAVADSTSRPMLRTEADSTGLPMLEHMAGFPETIENGPDGEVLSDRYIDFRPERDGAGRDNAAEDERTVLDALREEFPSEEPDTAEEPDISEDTDLAEAPE